ncbi:DUF488 domain-containing protein [Macrococcoides canis]|uniref:DUF488 domain-containing protein n=1 Tax=Macrococcoides canis TaxID=1855823 RepID=A0A1W7A807_9STAP|nr:DUF488 domain-containing protein [Macrococcus canis]ARQ05762.1 hypothetical protein MCCS_00900 [Macrococcus canis]
MKIFTIGHSTYTTNEFLEMLKEANIDYLVDIRAFPYSKKHPQFNGDVLADALNQHNIEYQHIEQLGGRRGQSGEVGESLNAAWNNASFHNYADYTLEEDFKYGIENLLNIAEQYNVTIMCSERHPARCHRLIISNYLVAHEHDVTHIIRSNQSVTLEEHKLGQWGAMPIIEEDAEVVYPDLSDNK